MSVRQATIKNNLSGGELSLKMAGRFELPIVQSGLIKMENFKSWPQGGASYREGTRYVANTEGNGAAILIPFQFNDEQSYVLELTDSKMRVFKDQSQVFDTSDTITGITQADPAVVTATGHSLSDGDEVYIFSVAGMVEVNGGPYLVANSTANTFELTDIDGNNIDSTGFTAYSSGGTADHPFELAMPYVAADLFELQYAQTADTMFICHRDHKPRKLTRTGHAAWAINNYAPTADPFTSSGNYPRAVTFFEQRVWFGGTDNAPQDIWGSVSGNYEDMTTGTADDDAMNFEFATKKVNVINWLIGAQESMVAGTFGGAINVKGGADGEPITPTGINVRPLDYIGSENQVPVLKDDKIIWVQVGGKKVRSSNPNQTLQKTAPENLTLVADHITGTGIDQMAYQEGTPDIIWCIRADGQLLGLTINDAEQITGWHRHVTGSKDNGDSFESVAIMPQLTGDDEVWVVVKRTINGSVRRFIEYFEVPAVIPDSYDYFTGEANESADKETFLREMFEAQKTYLHLDAALSYNGADIGTDATAAITPGATTGDGVTFTADNAVWAAGDVGSEIWSKETNGRATIVGFTSSTEVECDITVDFDSTTEIAAGDWYLTTNSLSGLYHLNGETVQVVTDGGKHIDVAVSDGKITLENQASTVHVGVKYTGLLVTQNLQVQSGLGATMSQKKRIHKVSLFFLWTLGAKVGTSLYSLSQMFFRKTSDYGSRPAPLLTGVHEQSIEDSWEEQKKIIVLQENPQPCNVLYIETELTGSE